MELCVHRYTKYIAGRNIFIVSEAVYKSTKFDNFYFTLIKSKHFLNGNILPRV
jgi:hypothetical protein